MKGFVDNGRFSVGSGWGLLNKTPHYGSYCEPFRNYFTLPEHKVFALPDYVKSKFYEYRMKHGLLHNNRGRIGF